MNSSLLLWWRKHCSISVSITHNIFIRLCCHVDIWTSCILKRDIGYFYSEEYWRFFPSFYFWCFVWHLVTHAILSFSYANRNSHYFWNVMMLTLFHASTIFSLPYKFCIHVTFFLISAKSLKRVSGKAGSGTTSKECMAQTNQSRQYLWSTSEFCLSVLVPLYHPHGLGESKVIHGFLAAWGRGVQAPNS